MGNICKKARKKKETLMWSFRDDCCICMENPIQTAFLDCGHLNCCLKCAKLIVNSNLNNINKCPICRHNLRGYVTFNPNFYYK